MNYFDFGKVVDGFCPLPYKGSDNPLYKIKWSEFHDLHCLPEMFDNNIILNDWFFNTIASQSGIGTPFSKNARNRTRLYFASESNTLTLTGTKTYSRRIERIEGETGIPRTYVSQVLSDRIKWFLDKSPYVISYKVIKQDLNYKFRINFKSQMSANAHRRTAIRNATDQLRTLEFQISKIENQIFHHVSLDTLKRQLALVKNKANETRQNLDKLKGY